MTETARTKHYRLSGDPARHRWTIEPLEPPPRKTKTGMIELINAASSQIGLLEDLVEDGPPGAPALVFAAQCEGDAVDLLHASERFAEIEYVSGRDRPARWTQLERKAENVPALAAYRHRSPAEGCCAMEAVSWLKGQPWVDRPEGVCPALGAAASELNDNAAGFRRERYLKPLLARIAAASDDNAAERRRTAAVRGWTESVWAPYWAAAAGLGPPPETGLDAAALAAAAPGGAERREWFADLDRRLAEAFHPYSGTRIPAKPEGWAIREAVGRSIVGRKTAYWTGLRPGGVLPMRQRTETAGVNCAKLVLARRHAEDRTRYADICGGFETGGNAAGALLAAEIEGAWDLCAELVETLIGC